MSQSYEIRLFNHSTTYGGFAGEAGILIDDPLNPAAQSILSISTSLFGPIAILRWTTQSPQFFLGSEGSGFCTLTQVIVPGQNGENNVLEASGTSTLGGQYGGFSYDVFYSIALSGNGDPDKLSIVSSGGGNGICTGICLGGQPILMGTGTFGSNYNYTLVVGDIRQGWINSNISNIQVKLDFPPGVFSLDVTINANNTFTIQ